jgi:methylenetetrahydrofolate dehydrogenase (NADP+)/methenyltetrahydrofolate cyclohydrolase
MTCMMIDGKAIALRIREDIAARVEALKAKGVTPGLAVILVGNDPASEIYVRNKGNGCAEVGMYSRTINMPEETTQEQLEAAIEELNSDSAIHGILVQLPLPKHLDENAALAKILPEKDVDGFHLINAGHMLTGTEGVVACTPRGALHMIKSTGVNLSGKEAVVIGRSNIVGKPMALLMLRENATVTVCHSKTQNLKEICKSADILIAAVGKPRMINSEYVKEGAVVIDVGIHRDENNKMCGDVDFDDVKDHVSKITPVPGGVGPMTIAMLMNNCVEAIENR